MSPLTRRGMLAAGAGALASLAGCTGGPNRSLPETPTGDWRHRAHDARNTGASDVTVPPRGTPAWDSGEAHVAAPLVADGTVYSVSHDITALDARTGDEQWEVDLPGKADHTPALLDGRLFVATDERLVALDPEDGNEEWSAPLRRPARGAVVATGDDSPLVAVPVADTGVVAFDPETGDRLWRDRTRGPRYLAAGGGSVYVAGYGSDGDTAVIRALAAAGGSRRWEREIDGPDAAPVVADDELLVSDDGRLAVHDRADGSRLRYLTADGGRIDVPPAVADETAYVAQNRRGFGAVSIDDGAVEWWNDLHVTVDTGLTVGRDAVVAPVVDLPAADLPGVAAFERADGSVRWEHPIEGFDVAVSTPAVLADGAVFYASNESRGVVALGDLPPEE